MRRVSLAFRLGLLVLISLLFLLPGSSASAQLIAPSFVRQWNAGASAYWAAHTTDPLGNVFVFIGPAGSGGHVTKYTHDGTPVAGQWVNPVTATEGMASDPAGRIFLVGYSGLLEFTNAGVFLGSFSPPHFGGVGPIAFDAAGNLYANGTNASGQRTVNEYHLNGANFALIHSANYPGSPNGQFAPSGFLGLTIDDDGSVYGSATTTTNSSLLKYPPSLGGSPGFLQDCAAGGPTLSCFGGFGIAFTHANVLGGKDEELAVFAAGGFGGGAPSSNFYRMGVFLTNAGPAGTSRYIGSYNQEPVPGNYTTAVGQVAASRCHAALYELVSVFGGPGGTLSNFEVQEFDTHAAPTPCPSGFTAHVGGFAKNYVLVPPKGGKVPCIPCVSLLKSGAVVSSANDEAVAAKKKRKGPGGVAITYTSSAAADTTFQFKRISGRGPKKKLGGFLYAAEAGKNAPVFSGVLRKKHRLSPGTYQVTVSAGQNTKRFKLIVRG